MIILLINDCIFILYKIYKFLINFQKSVFKKIEKPRIKDQKNILKIK